MPQSIANRICRFFFPKQRFASGSAEYPTPVDLFAAMADRLVGEDRWDFVSFEVPGTDAWVQLARSNQEFDLNFAYPFDEDPVELLGTHGINIPRHWRLDHLDHHKTATLAVPAAQVPALAEVIHGLFQRLFDCPPDYKATAYLE